MTFFQKNFQKFLKFFLVIDYDSAGYYLLFRPKSAHFKGPKTPKNLGVTRGVTNFFHQQVGLCILKLKLWHRKLRIWNPPLPLYPLNNIIEWYKFCDAITRESFMLYASFYIALGRRKIIIYVNIITTQQLSLLKTTNTANN